MPVEQRSSSRGMFAVLKAIRIAETRNLQLQAAAYNMTNYVQFGYPNVFWTPTPTAAAMTGFGQITSDLNLPRQFQFAARFTF